MVNIVNFFKNATDFIIDIFSPYSGNYYCIHNKSPFLLNRASSGILKTGAALSDLTDCLHKMRSKSI